MNRIGILGGTFNPPHNGHVSLAKKALKEFKLEKIIFIPSGLPPHKNPKNLASKKDRMKMVRLATKNGRRFKVSAIEINKKGYSYAIDTFKKLRKTYGSDSEIFYIMGLDSINDILNWKKPIELFKLCKFIVATRPGAKRRTLKRILKFPPISLNKDKIELTEMNMKVSSTMIRELAAKGSKFENLLPKEVADYIAKKGLYNCKSRTQK